MFFRSYVHTFFGFSLPAGLNDTWDVPFACELPETDTAKIKIAHIAAHAAAAPTAPHQTGAEFRLSLRFCDLTFFSHIIAVSSFGLLPRLREQTEIQIS